MTDDAAPAITTDAPDLIGLDYVRLHERGVRLTQAMSGDVWTDYNFSDPGVTILEQLCYALTELSYRACFSVPDLICEPQSGRIDTFHQGLYPVRAIMPVNPVTVDDLRRLVLDRTRGVGNVWFTPCPGGRTGGVNGLYDIALHIPGQDSCCGGGTAGTDEVVRRVRALYTAHRALCEDVARIRVLSLVPTVVEARVQIDAAADPNAVLARLQFAIGLLLAPEPKRTPLDALRAAGRTTAEIFDGPLMLRGFIDAGQLTPLLAAIPVADVLRTMAETEGVVSVDGLSVRVDGDSHVYTVGETVPVPPDGLLWLNARVGAEGRYPIRLFRGRAECRPDPGRVGLLLDTLWSAQRRTYPLLPAYARLYAVPSGTDRHLSSYLSVQNQFPNVYGINAYGLPEQSSVARRARAKQLKGYLMPFDQLMADYFAQLAFLRELFSVRAGGERTSYAVQSLRTIVPDVAPLLGPGYEAGLAAVTALADPVEQRRGAIIDLLLSLYAEALSAHPRSGRDCGTGVSEGASIRARQALLARMVAATRDRGQGFDYLRRDRRHNEAGMLIRCRIELGILDSADTPEPASGVEVTDDPATATLGEALEPETASLVERFFIPIDGMIEETGDGAETRSLAGMRVPAALLPGLGRQDAYRIGILPGENTVHVACRGNGDGWWMIGRYPRISAAAAAIRALVAACGGNRNRNRIHIVEHVLLRYAAAPSGTPGNAYSFRITAVIEADDDEIADANWRDQVTAIVRANTPAHIVAECLFLDRSGMSSFLACYEPWLAALRQGTADRRAKTSLTLQRFLEDNGAGAPPA